MDRCALNFKKTCCFTCVLLEVNATCFVKAHNFYHLFAHTNFMWCYLFTIGWRRRKALYYLTSCRMHDSLFLQSSLSLHFTQCTLCTVCTLQRMPESQSKPHATINHKGCESNERRLDSVLSVVGAKRNVRSAAAHPEMLVMACASLIGRLWCGKNRTNFWDIAVLVESFRPIRIFTAMTFCRALSG